MAPNVSFADHCYAYRMKEAEETDAELTERLARQFEDEILRVGHGRVAGFVAETDCYRDDAGVFSCSGRVLWEDPGYL